MSVHEMGVCWLMAGRFIIAAGCFPFRYHQQQAQLLLVQSASDADFWTLPGGAVKPKESLRQAATRELWEEAGAKGKILVRHQPLYAERKRGAVRFSYTYFLLSVTDLATTWPEAKKRKRQWVSLADMADVKLTHKGEILTKLLPNHPHISALLAGDHQ